MPLVPGDLDGDGIPEQYCLCLRPVDGRQDPEPTAQVCTASFLALGGIATEIEFDGPGGGYFGAVRASYPVSLLIDASLTDPINSAPK